MGFVDGFFSFSVDLTYPERELYTSTRVKIPKHPEESYEELHARLLAAMHSYNEGQRITAGRLEPGAPSVETTTLTGEFLSWVYVGTPETKLLQKALRDNPAAEFRIYFYEEGQVESFCHTLRGSKTNWVEPIQFYQFKPEFLGRLTELVKSSSRLELTIVDNSIYLTYNGFELSSEIAAVNIWHEYQESISNRAVGQD